MQKLEKEIEEVLRNRASTAKGEIINIGKNIRLQSAAGGNRASGKNMPRGGEEPGEGFGADIYEDEESSDDEDDDI